MNNALYNQIRIFQSIAREGNISAAARKLEITPPSVSNALKLLEEYIGHPLFVRTTRRIELTETGQLLLEQTAAAVESLENSLESIRDQHQEPSGMVRITKHSRPASGALWDGANYALAFCLPVNS